MPYPKKYVGHYPFLADWLRSQGHSVYPMEMICNPVPIKNGRMIQIKNVSHPFEYQETHYLYGFVDVVSMKHGKLWAWEYKSKGDNVNRAIPQLQNYARNFDYVSLVVENLSHVDRLVSKKGLYIKTLLRNLGAGIYWLNYGKIELVEMPKQQKPETKLHDELVNRFRRYVLNKPIPKLVSLRGLLSQDVPLTKFIERRLDEVIK